MVPPFFGILSSTSHQAFLESLPVPPSLIVSWAEASANLLGDPPCVCPGLKSSVGEEESGESRAYIDTSELGRYHQEAVLVYRSWENILSWRESPFPTIFTVPSSQDEGGR